MYTALSLSLCLSPSLYLVEAWPFLERSFLVFGIPQREKLTCRIIKT